AKATKAAAAALRANLSKMRVVIAALSLNKILIANISSAPFTARIWGPNIGLLRWKVPDLGFLNDPWSGTTLQSFHFCKLVWRRSDRLAHAGPCAPALKI